MDLLQYKKRRIDFFDDRILETDSDDDILFDDGYFQVSKYFITILHLSNLL